MKASIEALIFTGIALVVVAVAMLMLYIIVPAVTVESSPRWDNQVATVEACMQLDADASVVCYEEATR